MSFTRSCSLQAYWNMDARFGQSTRQFRERRLLSSCPIQRTRTNIDLKREWPSVHLANQLPLFRIEVIGVQLVPKHRLVINEPLDSVVIV